LFVPADCTDFAGGFWFWGGFRQEFGFVLMKQQRPSSITICSLLLKCYRSAARRGDNARFQLGLWLLLINCPFGYSALLLTGLLAGARRDPRWLYVGGLCYALSWLMLGAGVWLLGVHAKQMLAKDFRRKYGAWSRLRRRRREQVAASGQP
jgi:hypothetical protein